jgi:hypothetical protein
MVYFRLYKEDNVDVLGTMGVVIVADAINAINAAYLVSTPFIITNMLRSHDSLSACPFGIVSDIPKGANVTFSKRSPMV